MIAIFQVYRAFPLCDHQAVSGGQWKADMNVIYNNVQFSRRNKRLAVYAPRKRHERTCFNVKY